MATEAAWPLVAIVNTSEEITRLLETVLHHDGIRTAAAYTVDLKRGRQDIAAFLDGAGASVVIWDIAIPYAENWAFFERVRDGDAGRGRRFVLTTTNLRALTEIVGEVAAHEIIGKPYDLDAILAAVRRALDPPPDPPGVGDPGR